MKYAVTCHAKVRMGGNSIKHKQPSYEENPLTFIWLDGQSEPTPSQVRDPYFTWINPNQNFELFCIMYMNLLVTLTRQRGMFTNYQNRPHNLP
jgi:hypothetical protein